MPITTQWYDEKQTILLVTFDGDWSLEEFHQSIQINKQLSINITHPFVSIADFTSSSTPPRNMLSASSNLAKDWNPNYVGSILVRAGLLLQMLNKVMSNIPSRRREKLAVADTMEEALEQATVMLSKEIHEA